MRRNFSKILLFLLLGVISGNSFSDTITSNSLKSSNLFRDNVDGSRTLLHHMPSEVSSSTLISHADINQTLDLRIVLPLQNQTQLSALLKNIYDPNNSNYHHYITPSQFAQQFSSQINIIEATEFLKSKGLWVTGQSPNGLVLKVSGTVSMVEQAFNLHINNYKKSDGPVFFVPDADPIIPVLVAGKISAISGLDNLIKIHPNSYRSMLNKRPSQVRPASVAKEATNEINCEYYGTLGTGPCRFLAPSDVKTAYNLNSIPSNGSGQTIALFEMDAYSSNDITAYDQQFGLPDVPLQNILVDGFSGIPTGDGGQSEVTLDIELLNAFAPGLQNILVYEASPSDVGWEDEWTKIASDDLANIVSCSWSGGSEDDSPYLAFDNTIFSQMAAQGQMVFIASGDSGAYADAYNNPTQLVAMEPASQALVTAVGITQLSINSNGSYNNEIASAISGGGVSFYHRIGSYQVGISSPASTTMRNVPDVSLTADPATCYSFYIYGSWLGYGGSSVASPVWAAFMADVNQGRIAAGQPVYGFINPVLYQLAQNSTSYANDFHDITAGNNNNNEALQYNNPSLTGYSAGPGYDNATGLGSLNGANLYNDLVFSITTPTGLVAKAGNAIVTLIWNAAGPTATYNVKRSPVNGESYTTIASGLTTPSYNDTNVTNGISYYYVFSIVNAGVESVNSAQVSAIPLAPPSAPTGLHVMISSGQVVLSWNASSGATNYYVKSSFYSGGPYTIIGNTSNTTYTQSGLTDGETIYYVVTAQDNGTQSTNSAQVKAVLLPSAPTNLIASGGNTQVALYWLASMGAVSYNVKRSTNSNGPFITVSTPGTITGTGYIDNGLTNGTTYYYVVSGVNTTGEGTNSYPISATPVNQLPSSPSNLSATSGISQVTLNWGVSTGGSYL